MIKKFIATIDTDEGMTQVYPQSITSVGIIISDSAGDEISETLIPWHSVKRVWSDVEGALALEIG